jgi:hypothetical protein
VTRKTKRTHATAPPPYQPKSARPQAASIRLNAENPTSHSTPPHQNTLPPYPAQRSFQFHPIQISLPPTYLPEPTNLPTQPKPRKPSQAKPSQPSLMPLHLSSCPRFPSPQTKTHLSFISVELAISFFPCLPFRETEEEEVGYLLFSYHATPHQRLAHYSFAQSFLGEERRGVEITTPVSTEMRWVGMGSCRVGDIT